MSPLFGLLLPALYLLLARLALATPGARLREMLFAAVNLAGVYVFFYEWGNPKQVFLFLLYVGVVGVQYAVIRLLLQCSELGALLALWTPILLLLAIKYLTVIVDPFMLILHRAGEHPFAFYFTGLSYLTFRATRLVLEIRTGRVEAPNPWQYLAFCFFLPTLAVGPISGYAGFQQGLARSAGAATPPGNSFLRLLVGAVKYAFLAGICNQLSYAGLLLDGHPHHWIDLPVAAVFYYLYLYCNFSGFCDIAIGAAGLLGIPVDENFDHPFAARNIKDFWNRWHITLSTFMRDLVFSPLSKFLIGKLGPANANHAIALAITTVFLLVGMWHSAGWNFALFGAMHALGVVVNHYYTIGLKKWLSKARFKSYNENRWIHAVAVALTFAYVAASFFLFANDLPAMKQSLAAIRWR